MYYTLHIVFWQYKAEILMMSYVAAVTGTICVRIKNHGGLLSYGQREFHGGKDDFRIKNSVLPREPPW